MTIISVEGFIDTHVHTGPAPFRRIGDSIDVARWCREAGMLGIVVKSHFEATIAKVYHARKEVPDLGLYAGIALNRGVGGINPGAVEQALKQDARVVWMPTIDAENHVRVFGAPGAFGAIGAGSYANESKYGIGGTYTVLDGGRLTAEAKDGDRHRRRFRRRARDGPPERGRDPCRRRLRASAAGTGGSSSPIPEMQCPNLSIDTQIELARAGCLMEYCAVNCMPMFQSVTSDQMKEAIDAVGPENAVIATDSGQPFSPKLPDMFRSFAQVLYEKGVSLEAIATMAIRNPARLLGIEPRNAEVVAMDELFGVAQE